MSRRLTQTPKLLIAASVLAAIFGLTQGVAAQDVAGFTLCQTDADCGGERCVSAGEKICEEQKEHLLDDCARLSGTHCEFGAIYPQTAFRDIRLPNYLIPLTCAAENGACIFKESVFNSDHCPALKEAISGSTYRDKKYCLRFGLAPAAAAPAAEEGLSVPTVEFRPPILSIPIPGIPEFSEVKLEGPEGQRYYIIPWLAQYLEAIYRYALSIIGVVATVMIVYGGIRWLVAAGNATAISAAKKTITEAVIGLIIALGSYLILFTVNPEIVKFRALQVAFIERISLGLDTASEGNGTLTTGEEPRTGEPVPQSGDAGSYRAIAERVAETFGFNSCLFTSQITMESNWNPSVRSACCYGLGQVNANYAADFLVNPATRNLIASTHSRGEAALPQLSPSARQPTGRRQPPPPLNAADKGIMANWLTSDPEGNLIIAALMRKQVSRNSANPIVTTIKYGAGGGSLNSYVTATGCRPQRMSEDELIAQIKSGTPAESFVEAVCAPPPTWPVAHSGINCPGSNKCCREGTDCEQPNRDPGGSGRKGVCVGGSRNGQPCFAVAGASGYIKTYIGTVRRCLQRQAR